ncbi:MAG: ABC transporter substrate-binding protein [Acidimicrobiia bacterium]|nr:ABC transporter substrate-binding protein [Acidimicrobiia bacterium]
MDVVGRGALRRRARRGGLRRRRRRRRGRTGHHDGRRRRDHDHGRGQQASGEPIVIGYVNQEDTPAGSFPEIREAAEAAVEYVNNELGGVGGRPLALEICTTLGTPESAASCANELVEKGVLLVAPGIDFGTEASLPVLEEAGIPYIGGVPLLTPEYLSPVSFQFIAGSASAFPAQAVYLADEVGATKVNILYTDNPAGLAAADTFGKQVLAKKGITDVNLIPEKADAADFTPSVSAAAEGDPDAIMVLFAASGCG